MFQEKESTILVRKPALRNAYTIDKLCGIGKSLGVSEPQSFHLQNGNLIIFPTSFTMMLQGFNKVS